ncbi:hypothetical protein AALP_AA5G125400 [Arabis alpina]|uniref:Uncharacterized protein n=1 Tax=Arabis alpina TaxID=50452 RepID=A0A087GWN4_ARAAL|nr:hypothetical protein AALP_AA5G125400 [Arabis alpina]
MALTHLHDKIPALTRYLGAPVSAWRMTPSRHQPNLSYHEEFVEKHCLSSLFSGIPMPASHRFNIPHPVGFPSWFTLLLILPSTLWARWRFVCEPKAASSVLVEVFILQVKHTMFLCHLFLSARP